VGALALSAQCKRLEDVGRSGVLDDAGAQIDQVAAAYNEVEDALRAQVA
jgi:HPt (histidine-containing phosphotransfer) domain-containing protein